jgi:hypothetical protein
MSLRHRLSRLEKIQGAADVDAVDAFFWRMQEHDNDPRVSATVDNLWRRMRRLRQSRRRAPAPGAAGRGRVAGGWCRAGAAGALEAFGYFIARTPVT